MSSSQYAGVHIPNGCEVSIGDEVASLVSVGVLDGDSQIEVTYDLVEYLGSMAEEVLSYTKNHIANMSFNMVQHDLQKIQQIMGGLATVSVVSGSAVSGAEQVISSGWTPEKEYLLEGQNGDASKPTINSVSGSTSGAGSVDDDYFLVKGADGQWRIVLRTDGTATFATSESITINYDYTPAESKSLKFGSSSAEITPKIVEFKLTQAGKIFRVRVWAAKNESGLTFAFPAAQNDTPANIPVQMKGRIDTSRADGEQLLEIYDEIGV